MKYLLFDFSKVEAINDLTSLTNKEFEDLAIQFGMIIDFREFESLFNSEQINTAIHQLRIVESSIEDQVNFFLNNYGTLVRDDESDSYVDLMIDNHHCISWKGKEYYIAENNSLYNTNDLYIVQLLSQSYNV